MRQTAWVPQLRIAQDAAADELLGRDPLALVVGMLLDQQIPMERAFAGPRTIADRLGRVGPDAWLDAHEIATADPDAFAALLARPPAVHRFPTSMAGRVQALCAHVVERYGGDAAALWRDAADGAELRRRLRALPGFGEQKAQIFLALLGKQLGVHPPGWREAAGPYGEEGSRRSVADVTDERSLAEVRDVKAQAKRAARAARPGRG